ncbi:nucleolin-like [Macrobrachium nipponense]|uniref:nucleolin-like n=1 Tax=Macrobrachium nipponense TaxID=159736 RepID=UPI0030C7A462
MTPAFAFAIFGLALLAGLAFAVCWQILEILWYAKFMIWMKIWKLMTLNRLQSTDGRLEEDYSEDELEQEDSEDDLEEDNSEDDLEQEDSEDYLELEDSEDDLEEDNSEDDLEQDDSEDYLELEDSEDDLEEDNSEDDLEQDDSEDYLELEGSEDDLEIDIDEVSRLENRLEPEEMIKCEDTEDGLESEMTEVSRPEESSELDELTGIEVGPETVENPNILMTPAFAFAIPVLALLAGLAFAVCWNDNSHGNHLQELEDHLESERAEESRLEETLELALEKQRLTEELEESRVAADEMERLWKEAKEDIALAQESKMVEKDLLLRKKNADQEAVMKSEIAKLHHQNEEFMAEHQHLEDDLKRAVYEGERMQKLNNDLMEELEFLEKKCEEERIIASLIRGELELKEEENRLKAEIIEAELQVMKNWVLELGGRNGRLAEELEEVEMEVTSVKKELGNEKRRPKF